jgi:very-short-patch-repair endonuclease
MPEDLNNSDVRYRLLSYYLNPQAPPSFDPDWSKCESKFEETVGKIVHGHGYRIIPQYEPFGRGGKRLDYVIEGTMAKLALECDGDAFHSSPEDIHNDLVRQRQLERCGWVFWRIRESEFYWDRVKSMEPLWRRLSELGIAPHVKGENPPPSGSSSDQREPKHPEPPPAASNSSANQQATMPPSPRGLTRSPPSPPTKPIFVPRDPCSLVLTSDDSPGSSIEGTVEASHAELTPTEKLILDLLALPGRLDTNRLILEVVRRLGLRQDGRYKVELALRDLQAKGRIRLGVNYVERPSRG